MAQGQCKDCRFYDGRTCSVNGGQPRTPTSTCLKWGSHTRSTVKQCRECRFYDGHICSANGGQSRTFNATCGKWAAFR